MYTVGRRNVKDKPVTIKSGINDVLSLDFEYTDENRVKQKKTFNMVLDDGTFQGDSLAKMVQEKLNEQLTAAGLAENFIEVGIGGTNANVAGVDNNKVLTFKLTNTLPLPSSGEYIIDGIGGNASFSIFYQTTGDLIPAYVEGVKDVSEGVVIDDTNNILKFTTDGNECSIEIPEGEYSGDEIFDKLNELLDNANAPVKAEKTDDGRIRLSQKKMGNHAITNLSGTARGSLFFNESSGYKEDNGIRIQLSAEPDDYKTIDRPPMTTSFLGINSVTISRTKYATKALDRVKAALEKTSEVRSYFGTTQNALEHAVNSNNNTAENTAASESRIRDTDMAKHMVEFHSRNILLQAGQAMIAQANNGASMVLQLLE